MHKKTLRKIRKAFRNRAKIHGTAVFPRLSVFRSNKYMHAQLIDDDSGRTLVFGSTVAPKGSEKKSKVTKVKEAEALGKIIAKRAKDAGVSRVVFDRGSYKYHGRVKAVAEAAREEGLKI